MEQLQQTLNEATIRGWSYKRIPEYLYCTTKGLRNNNIDSKHRNELISYHELFSIDSGLMDFMERREPNN